MAPSRVSFLLIQLFTLAAGLLGLQVATDFIPDPKYPWLTSPQLHRRSNEIDSGRAPRDKELGRPVCSDDDPIAAVGHGHSYGLHPRQRFDSAER